MNYNEMITYVDQAITNSVEESYKLNWLNEIDRNVFRDICTEFKSVVISLSEGVANYTLNGFKFEDIQKVVVDGVEFNKMSALDYTEGSYYKDDFKISIFPVPTASSNELKIFYLYKPIDKNNLTQYSELELSALYGSEFSVVYEHYLRYKILFHQREYVESNQMAAMFNDALDTFSAWYLNNVANSSAFTKKVGWIIK